MLQNAEGPRPRAPCSSGGPHVGQRGLGEFLFFFLKKTPRNQQEAETKVHRNHKRELVSALHNLIRESAIVVVVHYRGMTVAESAVLRAQLRAADAHFKVTKNRLTRLAMAGTAYEGVSPLLVGPTALAFSQDPVSAARVLAKFARENNKLVILGGGHGATLLTPDGIQSLAELPSLGELRAQLVFMLQAPATRIVGLLKAPARTLAQVLKAYADREKSREKSEVG